MSAAKRAKLGRVRDFPMPARECPLVAHTPDRRRPPSLASTTTNNTNDNKSDECCMLSYSIEKKKGKTDCRKLAFEWF
jgi:hypothetical protein